MIGSGKGRGYLSFAVRRRFVSALFRINVSMEYVVKSVRKVSDSMHVIRGELCEASGAAAGRNVTGVFKQLANNKAGINLIT